MEFYLKKEAAKTLKEIADEAAKNGSFYDLIKENENVIDYPVFKVCINKMPLSGRTITVVLEDNFNRLIMKFVEDEIGVFPFLLIDSDYIAGETYSINPFNIFLKVKRTSIIHPFFVEFSNVLVNWLDIYYINPKPATPRLTTDNLYIVRCLFSLFYFNAKTIIQWNPENFEMTEKGLKFIVKGSLFSGYVDVIYKHHPDLFFIYYYSLNGEQQEFSDENIYNDMIIDILDNRISNTSKFGQD